METDIEVFLKMIAKSSQDFRKYRNPCDGLGYIIEFTNIQISFNEDGSFKSIFKMLS